jgi:hypothetical protein
MQNKKTPLRTLSEFAKENNLDPRHFNGRAKNPDAPKPVFKNLYALPDLKKWLKTLNL